MFHRIVRIALCAVVLAALASSSEAADQNGQQVKRGRYLVALGGCTDCHTPGHFLGKPDQTRYLGGSDVGFYTPHAGTFYGPNLTPDRATGLGGWTAAQIVAALQTGKRPDGRLLAPVMPWRAFAMLTKADAYAIAAFLKTLPPVSNKVAGPFGPDQAPSSFALKVVPPGEALTPK